MCEFLRNKRDEAEEGDGYVAGGPGLHFLPFDPFANVSIALFECFNQTADIKQCLEGSIEPIGSSFGSKAKHVKTEVKTKDEPAVNPGMAPAVDQSVVETESDEELQPVYVTAVRLAMAETSETNEKIETIKTADAMTQAHIQTANAETQAHIQTVNAQTQTIETIEAIAETSEIAESTIIA